MTANTPLEQALAAWDFSQQPMEPNSVERQHRIDLAIELGELDIFSKRHISLIVDLPYDFVCDLITKSDKTGGVFNPQSLPLLLDLANDRKAGTVRAADISTIVATGTGQGMIAKLTGIPRSSIARWVKEYEEAANGN